MTKDELLIKLKICGDRFKNILQGEKYNKTIEIKEDFSDIYLEIWIY